MRVEITLNDWNDGKLKRHVPAFEFIYYVVEIKMSVCQLLFKKLLLLFNFIYLLGYVLVLWVDKIHVKNGIFPQAAGVTGILQGVVFILVVNVVAVNEFFRIAVNGIHFHVGRCLTEVRLSRTGVRRNQILFLLMIRYGTAGDGKRYGSDSDEVRPRSGTPRPQGDFLPVLPVWQIHHIRYCRCHCRVPLPNSM